jgi:hypothetical protein
MGGIDRQSLIVVPDEIKPTDPFWIGIIENLTAPAAIKLSAKLDPEGPMGVVVGSHGYQWGDGKEESMLDTFFRIQCLYPHSVVLVKQGKFYESCGLSAIALIEIGLQPMAAESSLVPKAGTPEMNLQSTINDLIAAGFKVVVAEQKDPPRRAMRATLSLF